MSEERPQDPATTWRQDHQALVYPLGIIPDPTTQSRVASGRAGSSSRLSLCSGQRCHVNLPVVATRMSGAMTRITLGCRPVSAYAALRTRAAIAGADEEPHPTAWAILSGGSRRLESVRRSLL